MSSAENKVFLWPKNNTNDYDNPLKIVKLLHPRTRTSAMFLLKHSSELQEILNFKDGHRTWLFNDHVVPCTFNLNFCTTVDKVLLLLPYLEKSSNFCPLQDLVVDESFPSNQLIFGENLDISCVADKKHAANQDVYRFSRTKTLKYLLEKLERVVTVLKEKNIDILVGNFSSNYRDCSGSASDSDYKRFAHGIVSEYISNDLSQDLLQEAGLTEEPEVSASANKRSTEQVECEPNAKRVKNGSPNEPLEDYSKLVTRSKENGKTSTSKLSNAQKKLMNSSKKGMKSIQSFFGQSK